MYVHDITMASKITYNSSEFLGEGSYGTEVFRGFCNDNDDKKPVAVKVIPSIKKEKFVEEFQRLIEFSTHKKHENVVKYYHVDVTSGPDLLLAIEMCDITLEDFVEENVNQEIRMHIVRQLLDGLHFLHNNDITHGDLTPSNVLLQKQVNEVYVLKLADFCVSKIIKSRWMAVAKSSSGIQTTEWMAPEILRVVQALDKNRKTRNPEVKTTFSSDVFAVGLLIFYIASKGQHPYGEILRRESNILDNKKCLQLHEIGDFYWPVLFALSNMLDDSPQLRPATLDIITMSQFWNSSEDYNLFHKISSLISNPSMSNSASTKLMAQMKMFTHFVKESSKSSHPVPIEVLSMGIVENLIKNVLNREGYEKAPGKFKTHNQFWLKEHILSWKIMLVDSFRDPLDESLFKSKNDLTGFLIFLKDQVQKSEPDISEITECLSSTLIGGSKPTKQVLFDSLLNAARNGSFGRFMGNWRELGQALLESEVLKILCAAVQNSAKDLPTEVQDRIRILDVLKSEKSKVFRVRSANLLHLTSIHIDILIYLLKQDANVFAPNNEGQTLFHLCPGYLKSTDYCKLVNIICERNQDFVFKIPCSSGIYPLHAAVKMFELPDETIHLLHRRQHLSPTCIDNDGRNIFDIALCSQRSRAFLALLQRYEILPNKKPPHEQEAVVPKEKEKSIEEKLGKENSANPEGELKRVMIMHPDASVSAVETDGNMVMHVSQKYLMPTYYCKLVTVVSTWRV